MEGDRLLSGIPNEQQHLFPSLVWQRPRPSLTARSLRFTNSDLSSQKGVHVMGVKDRTHTRRCPGSVGAHNSCLPVFQRLLYRGGTWSQGPPAAFVDSRGAPWVTLGDGFCLALDDPLYNCPVPQFPHLSSVPIAVPAHRAAMMVPRYR